MTGTEQLKATDTIHKNIEYVSAGDDFHVIFPFAFDGNFFLFDDRKLARRSEPHLASECIKKDNVCPGAAIFALCAKDNPRRFALRG